MTQKRQKSGKREAGWVVFIIVTMIVGWSVWKHSEGTDMSAWVALFTVAWPTSMAAAVGPHVVHHLRPGE